MKRLTSEMRRLLLLIGGWFFVVLGVFGLFLPILQGVLFLFVGAALLSVASPRVRLWRMRLGNRYPALRIGQHKAQAWMKRQRARWLTRGDRN